MSNVKVENNYSGGVGFCGVLGVTFIVLKLCKIITWSWLWVTAPLWIPIVLSVIAILIFVIAMLASKGK